MSKFVKNHSNSGKSVTFLLVCRNLPGKANLKIALILRSSGPISVVRVNSSSWGPCAGRLGQIRSLNIPAWSLDIIRLGYDSWITKLPYIDISQAQAH